MCSYKLLAHHKTGYIIQCNACAHYQLAFGTTALSLSVTDFNYFGNQINELKIITVPNGFPEQKRIRVQLPRNEGTMMMLNYRELKELYLMLEEAMAAEEIEQLLSNNNLVSSGKKGV